MSSPPVPAHDALILIVDDDPGVRAICKALLDREGYRTLTAPSAEDALAEIRSSDIDIVLTDLVLPAMSGLDLLLHIDPRKSGIDVLLMTGHPTISTAVSAMKLGAYDYVTKPFASEELLLCVDRLAERRSILLENRRMRACLQTGNEFAGLVGDSPRMQQLFRQIAHIASTRQPVLITGESGTGKELVARAIHDSGPGRDLPFVVVDCGGLPANLIESELFGHLKGAFTGAHAQRHGLFSKAGNGTLFLDEVGELPLELQVKLLRALQEHQFRPVGSDETRSFDARVLAATNVDLEKAVSSGSFRKDLFYRLNVHRLALPSLRERRGDIPALLHALLARHLPPAADLPILTPSALSALMAYPWPGNIRELENCAQRLLALRLPEIDAADLPPDFVTSSPLPANESRGYLEEIERQAIADVLAATNGNFAQAAKILGVAKTTVYRKVKEFGLAVTDSSSSDEVRSASGTLS